MNWTEGNLNRHSRARKGKETLLRQKEHFAKVRAGLLDANVKISPPSAPSITLPAQSPSVRLDTLKSTSSRKQPGGDGLVSGRYFSEASLNLPTPAALLGEKTEEEALRQKRRKLLLKGDWVGTNVQKPIEMQFMKPRGSPSNPWGAKQSRRHVSKHKLRRLLGVTHNGGPRKTGGSPVVNCIPTLRRMKVRVGSHERALGDMSNASTRSSGRQGVLSVSRGKVHQSGYHDRKGHRQRRVHVSISSSDASHRSHNSASQTQLLTNSPSLFHPVPTRPALLQLLHSQSADSDNAASTLAQLGVERPIVPSSQAEENDVWRNFVAGSDSSSTLNEIGTSNIPEEAPRRVISPGISRFGISRQLDDTYEREDSVRPETRGTNVDGERSTPNAPASLFAGVVRPGPSHERSSEALSDDQITPVADDDSPSRVEFDPSQSSEGSKIDERGPSKEQAMTVNSSNGVSLLAVSSSPELPSSFETAGEDAPLQVDQPGDIATRLDAPSREPTVLHSSGKEPASLAEPFTAVQTQPPSDCTQADENDMWRKFVFGGSPENLDQALEDARRDTAKSLRPSLPPTSTSCDESPRVFATSSLGPDSIERRDFAEGLLRLAGDAITTGSPSHVATAGASSAELSSEPVSGSPETTMRTDQAAHGSPSSSSVNANKRRLFFQNDLAKFSIRETDTSSLTINPQQLESHSESDDCFKFAPPKLFVGKKIGRVNEKQQIALSAPQIRGPTQTRRRKRRTTDGRANIRKLPNYGSDPIEEFEGDSRSDRAEKGSMFGSLETEDVF